MKFATAVLIGAVSAVRIQQKGGDDFEKEAKNAFDHCAGTDGSLSLGEAVKCAKAHGHGDKVGLMKEHWPKDASGKPREFTFDDLKKAYEEHTGLAQKGEDSDMSEGEAKEIFDKCAGDDGSLSLKEAMDCAKESGHGKHAKGMKKHWPKDENGKPIEITWADAKKAWEEHNAKLAQKGGDDFEKEAKEAFDHCAGDDGSLSLGEAVKCAKAHGHGDKVELMKSHWPKDDSGKPREFTFDDLKKAYEEHMGLLAQAGDDSDMSEGEAKEIFVHCAGDDGSLSLREAVKCAKDNGHGEHVKGMKEHWPKGADGKPIEITWADAKKAWEEHNDKLAQKGKGKKGGDDEDDINPKEIFDFCAGDDGILEMHEAQACASKHVSDMIDKHWPRDDTGNPAKASWEDMQKWMEEHHN